MKNILTIESGQIHKPVLLEEVCLAFGLLAPLNNQAQRRQKTLIVDATIGGGGHAVEMLKRGAYVLGIDADSKMTKIAGNNLRSFLDANNACPTGDYDKFFKIYCQNFTLIDEVVKKSKNSEVDGILFDLGLSSYHYLSSQGFSFKVPDSILDMRLSIRQNVTASDLLNALSRNQLVALFSEVMPRMKSIRLAREVDKYRGIHRIEKVGDFIEILEKSGYISGYGRKRKKISDLTLPFMALRIAVNRELDNLEVTLKKSFELLKKGGVIAVISFHSGEDRIVKQNFSYLSKLGRGAMEKLVIPSKSEILINPRSRSAKLRVIKKL